MEGDRREARAWCPHHFATDAAALLCFAILASSKSGSLISLASCRPACGPSDDGSTAFIFSSVTPWFLSIAVVAGFPFKIALPSRTTQSVLRMTRTELGGRSSFDSSIRSALLGSRSGAAGGAAGTTAPGSGLAGGESGVPSPASAGRRSTVPLELVALTHPLALRTRSAPSLETRCSRPITSSPGAIVPTFRVLASIPERTASFFVAMNLAPRASLPSPAAPCPSAVVVSPAPSCVHNAANSSSVFSQTHHCHPPIQIIAALPYN